MSRTYENKRRGDRAETAVANTYDLDVVPEAEWYDCVNPRTGSKYEVKSVKHPKSTGNPGRFRIVQSNHRSLSISGGHNAAWYVFVILSDGNPPIPTKMRRVKPQTVTRIINDRGGWNKSGHRAYDKEHKIPVKEVF